MRPRYINKEYKPNVHEFNRCSTVQQKSGDVYHLCPTKYPLAFSVDKSEARLDKFNQVFMGFEWEVDIPYGGECYGYGGEEKEEQYYQKAVKLFAHSPLHKYLNYDSGGEPIEIRSIPATLLFHKSYMDEFFKLKLDRYFEETGDQVGFHVHVTKQVFTKESLYNFIWFINTNKNTKFINKIAGRNVDRCGWCTRADVDEDGIAINDKLIHTNSSGDCKDIAVGTDTGFDTIEVRIFKSPDNKQELYTRLEFVDALVLFSRDIYNVEKDSLKFFRQWVRLHRSKYPNLCKFMRIRRAKR